MSEIYDKAVALGRERGARNPHRWATDHLQKIGAFKEGTRDLTRRGREMKPEDVVDPGDEPRNVKEAAESASMRLRESAE